MKNEMCTLILAMLMCYRRAHSSSLKLKLTVNYYEDEADDPYLYHISVLFNNSNLASFKDCLCNKSSTNCNLVLSSTSGVKFTVVRVVQEIDKGMTSSWLPDWYLNHYYCEFQNHTIFCRRLNKFDTLLNLWSPTYFDTPTITSYCDLTCVQISWKGAQSIELSNNNMFVVNGGNNAPVCLSTTSTTVKVTRATTFKTTSQQTTIKLSASPLQQSSHKDDTTRVLEITKSVTKKLDSGSQNDDNDNNNTPVIVSVVMAVVVILAIVTSAAVVFYRRRQHPKSNNDANDHSRSGTETISIALKSFRNNVKSRLNLSKDDRKNMHGKRDEVELSHQMQGHSTIDYTNTQNLPEDNIGLREQSNLSETNMQNYVNHLSDHSNGIYNNSPTDPEFSDSVLEYSTIDSTSQKKGQLKGVHKKNMPKVCQENTYSNCSKPPTSLKDQDHTKIIKDYSSSNYELATSINRSVSDNIRVKPETLASNPPAGEYSRLGEKSRDIKNPYNTLPDTDDISTLALEHQRSRPEIEAPIASTPSENALTNTFSCYNDYSVAVYDGKSITEIGPSEYELATE